MHSSRSLILLLASVALFAVRSVNAFPLKGCLPLWSIFFPSDDVDKSAPPPVNEKTSEESACVPLSTLFNPKVDPALNRKFSANFPELTRREIYTLAMKTEYEKLIDALRSNPAAVAPPSLTKGVFSEYFQDMFTIFESYLPACDQMIATDQDVVKKLQEHVQYEVIQASHVQQKSGLESLFFYFPLEGDNTLRLETRVKRPESLCEVREVIHGMLRRWFIVKSDGRHKKNYEYHRDLQAQTTKVEDFLAGIIQIIYESRAAYNPFNIEWHEIFRMRVHALTHTYGEKDTPIKSTAEILLQILDSLPGIIKEAERKLDNM